MLGRIVCRLRPWRSSEEDSPESQLLDADLDSIFMDFQLRSQAPQAGCLQYERDSNFCTIYENQDETKPKTTLNMLVNSVFVAPRIAIIVIAVHSSP